MKQRPAERGPFTCAKQFQMDTLSINGSRNPLQELRGGIAFWRSKRDSRWPADFHNADYKEWANAPCDFSDDWWVPFRRRLNDWIAIRPATYAEVTERFVARRHALARAWATSCAPYQDSDITGVTWSQVSEFADLAGEIKPMKHLASPVFTSKFCHFLLPKVFPVVDNEGSGNCWSRYEDYFKHVQSIWASTPDRVRAALASEMKKAVESSGHTLNPEFPLVSKIVELRLIGRRHPLD